MHIDKKEDVLRLIKRSPFFSLTQGSSREMREKAKELSFSIDIPSLRKKLRLLRRIRSVYYIKLAQIKDFF